MPAKTTFLFAIILLFCSLSPAQYPNVRVSDPASLDPEEVTIAVNPVNPDNLAMGANLDYYYYSFDGGQTWTEGNLSSSLSVFGDPCVIFDAQGNLYYGHLTNPPGPGWLDELVVQKSQNGGFTWSNGVGVGFNNGKDQDKEWIIADQTQSPYRHNLYMSWTEFDSYGSPNSWDSTRIRFARSTDGGQTWNTPLTISDVGGDCLDDDNTVEGAVPAVGPNGEVYVSWSGPLGIVFDKSLDGGLTFGSDVPVVIHVAGWAQDVEGIYRCNGMPVTVCDISNSPYQGTIYIVYADQISSNTDTDIFMVKSTDGGQTWTPRQRVNDDQTSRHQFFPWACVDPVTGVLYVVFYDRRNTGGTDTEVWMARSQDGGATFQNFAVSATPFTPDPTIFFGDYTNIAAYGGKAYPAWMRLDGWNLSVWMAIVDDTALGLENPMPLLAKGFRLEQNYPNPFNSRTVIKYYLGQRMPVVLTVTDNLGKQVAVLESGLRGPGLHNVSFDAAELASGVYHYVLKTPQGSRSRRMLLVK